jgi:hypothetical protein
MSTSSYARPSILFLGIALLAYTPALAHGQGGTSASNALAQLSSAFSGGQVVHTIQLSGTAAWTAGSLQDSGTVSLTATAGAASQLQLQLDTTGQRTETQTGAGLNASCQWSGADNAPHSVDLGNCWRPDLWFLPALSLQPSLLPSYLGIVDLGVGTVGFTSNAYRHLQSQLVFTSLTSQLSSNLAQQSTMDLGLDPVTLLPAVLAYTVHPDNGAQVQIAIEIHYSNYQTVNGVQVPFHIQRYVNGALQLDILLNSAQIN